MEEEAPWPIIRKRAREIRAVLETEKKRSEDDIPDGGYNPCGVSACEGV